MATEPRTGGRAAVDPCPNRQTWSFDPVSGTVPPRGWAGTGQGGGYVYQTCDGDAQNPQGGPGWVWVANPGDPAGGAPAVPAPAELAQQAFDELAPPVPQFDFRPRQHPGGPDATLVGLWTFFWADQGGLVPLSRRVAAGGNWAEVTATIRQVAFDPGDGSAPLSCPGGGTPYNPDLTYERQVTSCAHRYDRASPAPGFTATATVTWSATWAGSGGTGGVLPDVTATATAVVPVQEMQVVNN
ncbi:hypothetical protein BBK14_13625 [Parafrankia soli]|uniref:ATP/GTP-binding protein n=1 Tax=Parafrankia soli TaxID=2599596 RepID=A0A1S1R1D5_9ACTN|nr:hypothetical protein BBK14_13625 [Parafrankia soli]